MAGAATAGAVGLSVVDGLYGLITGGAVRYSPEVAVLTATLIAVIWYTQYTFELLEYQRSAEQRRLDRSRRSLATGLLAEVWWLEGQLRQIAAGKGLPVFDPLDRPVMRSALSQLPLLRPETSQLITALEHHIREVQLKISVGRSPEMPWSEVKRHLVFDATIAVNAIPPLVAALLSEGGTMPIVETLSSMEAPPLVESPFGDFSPRTGWSARAT